MAKAYGIGYRGSKNSIAEWVVGNLPPAETLVDLFAGGCAVTHCALQSGRWARVIANDLTDTPSVFVDAVNGRFLDYDDVPDREEWLERKDSDRALAVLYSFGNGCSTYLWGRDVEDAHVHVARMLAAPTLERRKEEFKAFLRSMPGVFAAGRTDTLTHPDSILRLLRLQRAAGSVDVERLVVCRRDYREVEVPEGAVVYCDPPYRGGSDPSDMRGYGDGDVFDFEAFDEWLLSQEALCVVSDYVPVPGCEVVARREKIVKINSNCNSLKRDELLMVPSGRVEEYVERLCTQRALF